MIPDPNSTAQALSFSFLRSDLEVLSLQLDVRSLDLKASRLFLDGWCVVLDFLPIKA
jgi:hypothetical protein